MHKKIIRQYYVLSCLFDAGGLSVISAIYVTFLMRNGLDLFQVNAVNASYFLAMFLCEIPTGAFADIFGRKPSFVLACALMCISMIVYGLSHGFGGFLAAELLAAAACAFKNGAFQAWLMDNLNHYGYQGDTRAIFGREIVFNRIGGGIGAITGSCLYAVSPSLTWFVSGACMAVTMTVAFFIMKEDYFMREEFSWKESYSKMRNVAVKSVRYGLDDKAVRFVLLVTGMQIFSVQALNMYWQPFFKGHGVGERNLGFVYAGILSMLAVGGLVASKLKAKNDEKRTILVMLATAGILAIIATGVPGAPLIVGIFLLHEIPRGATGPLITSYLQKRIPSAERATISSFCSTAPHIGGAIGLFVSGVIAQRFGIATAWVLSGLALVIGAIWLGRNGNGKED